MTTLMRQAEDFGHQLIKTGDLDPVYIAIVGANLPEPQLCRLLLAYTMFYHLGAAAWLSEHEGVDYWNRALTAAENDEPTPVGGRWPRGAERRHFRGMACVKAVYLLASSAHRSPELYFRSLRDFKTEREIMTAVQGLPLYGPWIAFKSADLMYCCYPGAQVKFGPEVVLMYKEPKAALNLLDPVEPERAYRSLLHHFNDVTAPPLYNRPCGPPEVETILCKFKSMLGGHYHLGKDIHEVGAGLTGWGETAARLAAAMPKEVKDEVPSGNRVSHPLCSGVGS